MSKLKVSFLMMFVLVNGLFLSADDFDMKDPKGVNSILFSLDAPLEVINGSGNDLSGKVSFDPANAKTFNGEIVLNVDSLKPTNSTMAEHLHSEGWLDKAKHPKIEVAFLSVESAEKKGDEHVLQVKTKITVKGISKDQTITISVTHLPGKLGERIQKKEGDLLALRSVFTIKRSDFGLQAGEHLSKVADDIKVSALLIGHKFKD